MHVALRKFAAEDVEHAVKVHVVAFPTFFLSSLGEAFLRELYRGFLQDQSSVHYVAVCDGRICGAAVGTIRPQGFFKRLLISRWWAFAIASIAPIIRRPSIALRIARGLFYRGNSPSGTDRALLSSIAVDPAVRNCGVGKALLAAWLGEVRARGASGCYLTTDALGNDAVNQFYQRQGWKLESTFTTPEGRKMNCYIYDFKLS